MNTLCFGVLEIFKSMFWLLSQWLKNVKVKVTDQDFKSQISNLRTAELNSTSLKQLNCSFGLTQNLRQVFFHDLCATFPSWANLSASSEGTLDNTAFLQLGSASWEMTMDSSCVVIASYRALCSSYSSRDVKWSWRRKRRSSVSRKILNLESNLGPLITQAILVFCLLEIRNGSKDMEAVQQTLHTYPQYIDKFTSLLWPFSTDATLSRHPGISAGNARNTLTPPFTPLKMAPMCACVNLVVQRGQMREEILDSKTSENIPVKALKRLSPLQRRTMLFCQAKRAFWLKTQQVLLSQLAKPFIVTFCVVASYYFIIRQPCITSTQRPTMRATAIPGSHNALLNTSYGEPGHTGIWITVCHRFR